MEVGNGEYGEWISPLPSRLAAMGKHRKLPQQGTGQNPGYSFSWNLNVKICLQCFDN